jgi:uncharacterized protein (TIGR00106 family)
MTQDNAANTGASTMVLLEFAMTPHGQGESLSPYVARILDVIDRSGVAYQLTPMGTILEGSWDEVMGVVGDCFRALEADCPRIAMNLKMDYRAGSESRLQSKVAAVEQRLGRKLHT